MTPEVVIEKIIAVIQQYGEQCGYATPPIVATTCPFKDLPWFESYMVPYTMGELTQEFGISIPPALDIFKDKGKELSICDAANKLLETLNGK